MGESGGKKRKYGPLYRPGSLIHHRFAAVPLPRGGRFLGASTLDPHCQLSIVNCQLSIFSRKRKQVNGVLPLHHGVGADLAGLGGGEG